MISKFPKWVEIGAFVLALVAGFINAIGLLGFEHQSVSHLSGTASLLGASILDNTFLHTLNLLGIVISFLIGASLAGFLLHGTRLKLGRHYDTALFIEAMLLVTSFVFLSGGSFYGVYFASAACGLQNSLASTYSGAVVRTTHLTGIFTDLGIMIGGKFRGEKIDKRKAKLFMLIIVGFISGGTVGAFCYDKLQFTALLLPASVCLIVAVIYRVYFKYHPMQD